MHLYPAYGVGMPSNGKRPHKIPRFLRIRVDKVGAQSNADDALPVFIPYTQIKPFQNALGRPQEPSPPTGHPPQPPSHPYHIVVHAPARLSCPRYTAAPAGMKAVSKSA